VPVTAKPTPAPANISALPNPNMNTPQILGVGTLAAALLATTPVAAQAATRVDNLAQTAQQTNPAPGPANSQTTDNPPATPPAPQWNTQMGIATWSSGESPVLLDTSGVLNGKTVTAIASSGGDTPHWLALCSDGNVAAWGDNTKGQLGNGKMGSSSSTTTPVLVTMPSVLHGVTFTSVAAYGNYSMALTSEGTVYVWGTDGTGDGKTYSPWSFHDDSTSFANELPRAVPSLAGKKAVGIAAGSDPLFLCSDGSLYTWGAFWRGYFSSALEKLGSGSWPYGVFEHKTVTTIAGGRYHLLALCSDGTLAFWGFLGDDLPYLSRTSRIPNGINPQVISKVPDAIPPPNINGMTFSPRPLDEIIVREKNEAYYRLWAEAPSALDTKGVLQGKTITTICAGGGNNCLAALCSDGTLVIWRSVRLPDAPPNSVFPPASSDILRLQTQTGRTPYVMAGMVETATGRLRGKKVTAMGSSASGLTVACSDGTVAEWDAEGKLSIIDASGVLQGKKILAVAPGIALFSDQGDDASTGANHNSAKPADSADPTNSTVPDSGGQPNPLGPDGAAGAFKSFGQ
jgi:alpha-tubulin suppressor-like RCC1 family protein